MKIDEHYASAISKGSLRSTTRSTKQPGDVVGAVGLAGKERPLATALLRLFVGDNGAAKEIVAILEDMAVGKAFRLGIEIHRLEARDMAKAVLAWHRDGVCKPCEGRGFDLIPGAPSLSDNACTQCHGSGKMPFNRQFKPSVLELAQWLSSEVEREQAMAGQAAMKKLAPMLDLDKLP